MNNGLITSTPLFLRETFYDAAFASLIFVASFFLYKITTLFFSAMRTLIPLLKKPEWSRLEKTKLLFLITSLYALGLIIIFSLMAYTIPFLRTLF